MVYNFNTEVLSGCNNYMCKEISEVLVNRFKNYKETNVIYINIK